MADPPRAVKQLRARAALDDPVPDLGEALRVREPVQQCCRGGAVARGSGLAHRCTGKNAGRLRPRFREAVTRLLPGGRRLARRQAASLRLGEPDPVARAAVDAAEGTPPRPEPGAAASTRASAAPGVRRRSARPAGTAPSGAPCPPSPVCPPLPRCEPSPIQPPPARRRIPATKGSPPRRVPKTIPNSPRGLGSPHPTPTGTPGTGVSVHLPGNRPMRLPVRCAAPSTPRMRCVSCAAFALRRQ